jgi:hypothetical protein
MNAIVSDAPLAHFRRTLGKLIQLEKQQSIMEEPAHA